LIIKPALQNSYYSELILLYGMLKPTFSMEKHF
jgi:hypothetical protein